MALTGRKKKSNMRDVARHAGVSVATVSRVLNDANLVSQDTRRRVEQAISDLRFVRSPAARAINSGRSHLIGAVIPTLDNAIFARFLASLEEELATRALSLVVATTGDDPAQEVARAQKLLDLGVEGLVVSGVDHAKALTDLVERRDVPMVATSYYDATSDLPTIGYDNDAVGRMALQHLLELGHDRIGVLSGPTQSNDRTRARLRGVLSVGKGAVTPHETEVSIVAAGQGAATLFDSVKGMTALLCLSDVLAHGALYECQRRGIKVPADMSVMGVDDLPSSQATYPSLTSVHLPVARMGRHAARALADWVGTGTRPDHCLFDAEVVVRGSTGPRRQ